MSPDFGMLVLRLLHILTGTVWVGTLVFNATFLLPAMQEAGPEGAKVAAGIIRRRFMVILPAIALVSILSGLWLYWRDSAGFQAEFMRSSPGMAFGVGAVVAIIAFVLGVTIVRPAMLRATALSQAAASGSSEREAQLATAQVLRLRAAQATRWIALLLLIAAAAMAVARYL